MVSSCWSETREVCMSAMGDTAVSRFGATCEIVRTASLSPGRRAGLQAGLGENSRVVLLTCVDEQTGQGTEQFQGQDGQDEVQVPAAGLREGMLDAQDEEKRCAA